MGIRATGIVLAAAFAIVLQSGPAKVQGQQLGSAPQRAQTADAQEPPSPLIIPGTERGLPINLPTALQLAQARPIDVALASASIQAASAQLKRASVLWLPTIMLGTDYYFHTGLAQDTDGSVVTTDKNSFTAGYGPYAVFAVTDAIFEPLAARQVLQAQDAFLKSARNDVALAVAESYFNVQQARGELAGALDVTRRLDELVRRVEKLAPGIAPSFEIARARTELARRRQTEVAARAYWRTSSAELVRLLRLAPSSVVEPLEPPYLRITLLDPADAVDNLIPVALTNRPELAAHQALVQATLQRLRQERIRPLVPSILLRGTATQNPAGTLASGFFYGDISGRPSTSGGRNDYDLQVLWQLENFGLGNLGRVKQRQAENKQALLQLFRTQDLVAAEVVRVHAEAQSAAQRMKDAESEVREALVSVEKNFEGLRQTHRAGNLVLLVTRPQEAVAAVQALAQAYTDYYTTVADYNRSQFRLYRALGAPGHVVAHENLFPACTDSPTRATLSVTAHVPPQPEAGQ